MYLEKMITIYLLRNDSRESKRIFMNIPHNNFLITKMVVIKNAHLSKNTNSHWKDCFVVLGINFRIGGTLYLAKRDTINESSKCSLSR